MIARVQREGDRVWLEGVRGWSFAERESSVHAAQEAAMHAIGESVCYEYLLGVSALAFRLQVSVEGLCPSSPHSFCGYQCVARSARALPWSIRVYTVAAEDRAAVAEARRAVVESIDCGVPVQYGSEEDGVIIGYAKGGAEWLCLHPFHEDGKTPFRESQWPWGVAVYTGSKAERASRRELAQGALEQADNYYVGYRAWEAYMDKLAALDEANDAARQAAMMGNSWIYQCLARYRAAAAAYLDDIAAELPAAGDHLHQAAALYARLSGDVLTGDKCLMEIAPPPWGLADGQSWTAAMRAEQIARLREALPLERAALAEIAAAL